MAVVDAMSIFSRILESGLWDSRNEPGTEKVNKADNLVWMNMFVRRRVMTKMVDNNG
jgi:hypothetical protein